MNIFYLHSNPIICARMYCDEHCGKMIVEYAQMLSTAHNVLDGDNSALYKSAYINHPCNVWVRSGRGNYKWLYRLYKALSAEFEYRRHKTHKSSRLLPLLRKAPINANNATFVEPPQCMPDKYKAKSAIIAYRNFYIGDKSRFATWKWGRRCPIWYKK